MSHQFAPWPILKSYDQDHLARIALPLGGIGTGTVSLGGKGDLRDWEIMNRPAKGFVPVAGSGTGPFFALFAQSGKQGAFVTRAIEGPIELEDYEASHGCRTVNHGLPRFRQCTFAAAYPLGQVMFTDPDVPLDVRLEAFNPLVPNDVEASGIPVAVLRFVLINPTDSAVAASICGNLPNFIGMDGSQTKLGWGRVRTPTGAERNRNTYRESDGLRGIFMDSQGVDPSVEQWGTIALTTTARTGVTFRTAWAELSWGDTLLDFWDDFSADGALQQRVAGRQDVPFASLAARVNVPPHGEEEITFLLTWHFPNRQTWTPRESGKADAPCCTGTTCADPNRVGNYYTTCYRDAWHVAEEVVRQLPHLEAKTVQFVRAFCDSDLPEPVKEAALFNLANLRSQTCFRTEDGRFFGWEGCHDQEGCCHGSCSHVWNYEHATAFLFGDVARSMRETEFLYATRDDGLMSFRVNLPLQYASEQGMAAADGQMGCLMRLYREWQLSGDDEFLQRLWPKARQALEFCWIPGGWDADRDGVMEGCQHNTMDVEYYGPNPQMGTWYLGALRAAEEMARHLGEADFAEACQSLFERGSQWMDAHLFNGEYYEHEIRPPEAGSHVAEGLRVGMGATDLTEPELQLGAGCLVDQLVGQFTAHVCGLGYLLDRKNVTTTLGSVVKYNFQDGFHTHFSHMRSFVLGDEAGLLMATYPRGRRPTRPFPYYNEVMTGFEYAAAIGMLYEEMLEEGLTCIRAIRARYDGRKRSPFDEAECGHHYARAMASWAALVALGGFHYSAVSKQLQLAPRWKPEAFCSIWVVPSGWGMVTQTVEEGRQTVRWEILDGQLTVQSMRYTLPEGVRLSAANVKATSPVEITRLYQEEARVELTLPRALRVASDYPLVVCMELD
jgi:non-lysosomal glucosylceramidase